MSEIFEAHDHDEDGERPDVAMQIFGFLVAVALVAIAATFVYDSLKDVL